MQQQPYDWRDEPRRFSISSLVLLLVFVGAVAGVVYAGYKMEPWASNEPVAEVADATEAPPAAGEVTPVIPATPVP